MKKLIYILLLLTATTELLSAQSIQNKVTGSAGKAQITGVAQLDYTVGEPFVKTLTSSSSVITQGFHQPNVIFARLADATDATSTLPAERLNEKLESGIDMTVYPNPAVDFIYLKLNHETEEQLTITITNMQGQVVRKEIMQEQILRIDFSSLAAGSYLVMVKNEKGNLGNSYKVIKTE